MSKDPIEAVKQKCDILNHSTQTHFSHEAICDLSRGLKRMATYVLADFG